LKKKETKISYIKFNKFTTIKLINTIKMLTILSDNENLLERLVSNRNRILIFGEKIIKKNNFKKSK